MALLNSLYRSYVRRQAVTDDYLTAEAHLDLVWSDVIRGLSEVVDVVVHLELSLELERVEGVQRGERDRRTRSSSCCWP